MQKSAIIRYFIIFYCLLSQVNIIVAQSSSIKEQINAIKLNDVYLYGEAKHKIEELAILHAKKDLVNTVNELRTIVEEIQSLNKISIDIAKSNLKIANTILQQQQADNTGVYTSSGANANWSSSSFEEKI